MDLQLFPPEDTIIRCKTPEGNVIEVDAMDIDNLVSEVFQEYNQPEIPIKEYLTLVCNKFNERYGYRMSKRSMDLLLEAKTNLLENVKKNTYQQSEPVDSTESNQETLEN